MKIQKAHVVGASVVAVVAAVAIGIGVNAARGDDNRSADGVQVVDWAVPQHELLDDVLAIDAKRSAGGFNFSYVPKTRPEGLRRLVAGTTSTTVLDGYQLDAEQTQLFAEFAEKPTGTCASIKADPGSGLCVRETTVAAAADDPKLRNLTIYLGQVGTRVTIPDNGTTRGIRQFWSEAEMVPVAEASWFSALVAEAKAAPKKRLG